jgi:peptide deformylase
VECSRPDFAKVEGQDLAGDPVAYKGSGLLARCLQHETDHCYGTVFGDRLNKRTRKRLFKLADECEADFPEDWPVTPEVKSAAG